MFKILKKIFVILAGIGLIMWMIISKNYPSVPSINFTKIACILGGIFFFLLIALYMLLRKGKKKTVVAGANPSAGIGKDKGKKLTLGQQIKRWWLIFIFGIPVTGFIAFGMWGLVYKLVYKPAVEIYHSSKAISATYIWKKKPYQYGRDPGKRTSGYLNATITEDSDSKFCFTVHVGENDSHYNGRKVKDKIEGSWKNPPDGGRWYLEKDKTNPRLYKGGINDPYLSDWANLELEID